MLQKLLDKLAVYRVKRNCGRGKHRITVKVTKTDCENVVEYYCQSCGYIEEKERHDTSAS